MLNYLTGGSTGGTAAHLILGLLLLLLLSSRSSGTTATATTTTTTSGWSGTASRHGCELTASSLEELVQALAFHLAQECRDAISLDRDSA